MKASEVTPWRPALAAGLAGIVAAYYFWLIGAQPVPPELPRSSPLPGVLGPLPYARAPPWPAVEWNVWQGWRDLLPLQVAFYAAFLAAARGARRLGPRAGPWPLALVGCLFCIVLRGVLGAVLTVLVTAGFYHLATSAPRSAVMPIAWLSTVLLMQACFTILSVDDPDVPLAVERWLPALAALPGPLGLRGVIPFSTFRYDALRLLSFAGDVVAQEADAGLGELLAYQLYPPLVPAGPVLRYVDFVAQLRVPRPWPARKVAAYVLRTLGLMLLIEASLYVLYFPAWFRPTMSREEVLELSPCLLFGAVHWVVQFEWLSLAAVWRLPRAVALIDGMETPEDMPEPLCFPMSFKDVWRLWHASLNLWSARYIYRPLGGRKRAWLSVPATFMFVAFWHDIRGFGDRPYWYVWAALNSAFLLLESAALPPGRVKDLPVWWVAIIGANSILALLVANLPALLYARGFTVVGAVLLGDGSSGLLLALAAVFGAGAVFTASRAAPGAPAAT